MDITFAMVARTSSARTRQTASLVHPAILPVEQVRVWAEQGSEGFGMRINIDITERPGLFSIRYETATCVTEDTPRVLLAGELLLAKIVKTAESVLKATKPRATKPPKRK